MAFIRTIPPNQATGRLKEIYDDKFGKTAARIPAYQAFSIRSDLMETLYEWHEAHFLSPTPLPPVLRQLIAFNVSKENSCRWCAPVHSVTLRGLGFDDSEYKRLFGQDRHTSTGSLAESLVEFSRKATLNIGGITSSDTKILRDALGDEGNYVEAVYTIAAFNLANRATDALGVSAGFLVKSVVSAFNFGVGGLHPLTGAFVKMTATSSAVKTPVAEEVLRGINSLYRTKLGLTAVPPFYEKLSLRPIQMKTWADMARTFMGEGVVPLQTKMRIGRILASLDGYDWFLHESDRWLAERGYRSNTTESMGLVDDSREQQILHFARDVALNASKITQKRITELKDEGLTEEEILELVCVAAFFSGESRLYKCLSDN